MLQRGEDLRSLSERRNQGDLLRDNRNNQTIFISSRMVWVELLQTAVLDQF